MTNLGVLIQPVLARPTPAALVDLQGALLACDRPPGVATRALALAGQFHAFLCDLESKLTARQYSELASRLDLGAVGMVALENLVSADRAQLWERLLLGGLGEVLMVAASRQYVRAWKAEAGLVYRRTAWELAEHLYVTSCEMQPEMPPDRRWQAICSLLEPAHRPDIPDAQKAALLGTIFQVLLLLECSRASDRGVAGV